MTGCKLPCAFRKFTLVGSKLKSKAGNKLKVSFSQDTVNSEMEDYVYDQISFVAECGGAMGLFLGFSMI